MLSPFLNKISNTGPLKLGALLEQRREEGEKGL
jgi:hypothetical protein